MYEVRDLILRLLIESIRFMLSEFFFEFNNIGSGGFEHRTSWSMIHVHYCWTMLTLICELGPWPFNIFFKYYENMDTFFSHARIYIYTHFCFEKICIIFLNFGSLVQPNIDVDMSVFSVFTSGHKHATSGNGKWWVKLQPAAVNESLYIT